MDDFVKWEDRHPRIKSFEDGGFLMMSTIGMIEDDNTITFFLDEDEKLDACAISWIADWGFNDDDFLTFQGIFVEDNKDIIQQASDEWSNENMDIKKIRECIKVIFKK